MIRFLSKRRDFPGISALVLAVVAVPLWLSAAQSPPRPNIIFIMADDMGSGDVACFNPDSQIPTPNLDRLGKQGMRFTNAHTPSAVCTPTRYALVTGRYSWRSRLKRGVLGGYSPHLIDPERKTVADVLHESGYRTAVVGKWHLGLDWAKNGEGAQDVDFSKPVAVGPPEYGFDFSHIIPASLDMPPYVYVENNRVVQLPTANQPKWDFPAFIRAGVRAPDFRSATTLDHLLEKAVGFIRRAAEGDQPFFLYFPLTAPHKPIAAHPRFQGKTKLGPYGDFVHQVDWTVGEVLNTLDELDLAENTLVFYTSDNGSYMYRRDGADEEGHVDDPSIQAFRSDRHRANFIYRGTKADIYEGGHRVPFIARWPGTIEPGTSCDETICHTDLLATVAEIAGMDMPADAGEDSFSLMPLLRGQLDAWDRAPVIHHSGGGMFAIRDGKWKLIAGNGSGGRAQPRGKPFEKPYQLFDMEKDPSETTNLIDKHPDVAERLTAKLEQIRSSGRSRP